MTFPSLASPLSFTLNNMGYSQRRLAQALSERQYKKLKALIPQGDRRRVFSVLIDGLIELLETEDGPFILGAIATGRIKVQTILDAGIKRDAKTPPESDNGNPSTL